jgi:hypothetical protein
LKPKTNISTKPIVCKEGESFRQYSVFSKQFTIFTGQAIGHWYISALDISITCPTFGKLKNTGKLIYQYSNDQYINNQYTNDQYTNDQYTKIKKGNSKILFQQPIKTTTLVAPFRGQR